MNYIRTAGMAGLLALTSYTSSCSSASFGGSNGTGSPAAASPGAAPPGSDATPGITATTAPAAPNPSVDANSSGNSSTTPCAADAVTLDYSSPQESCLNSGKTWDFKTGQCGSMPGVPVGQCTWSFVTTWMASVHITSSAITAASTNGSKLVSCGQSGDKNRLAVQFVAAGSSPMPACTGTPASAVPITTGCYEYNPNGAQPTIPPGPSDAYDQWVYGCMDAL